MNLYLKWLKNKFGEPMFYMGNDFGYCYVTNNQRNNWRDGFSSMLSFGIFSIDQEVDPPYKNWERDCLIFFFEKVSKEKANEISRLAKAWEIN